MKSAGDTLTILVSRSNSEAPLNRLVVYSTFALCVTLLLLMSMFPRGPFVIVITNPANAPQDAVSIIAAADGMFVANGIKSWISVAYSDAPNFPARLMKAGAWIVLNGNSTSACVKDR